MTDNLNLPAPGWSRSAAAILGGLFVLGVLSWCLWPRPEAPVAPPVIAARPSIILISLDTLRPDHLGCHGYPRPTSPNLDRFARQCVRFTHCWAQSPWTLPSHMSLFTSLPPGTHRVDSINKVLPAHITTLPRLVQQAGWHTAALVNNGQMKAHWGFARGFDTWREFAVDRPEGACPNLTRAALQWLQSRPQEQPFFLFLHYYDAHDPYDAPQAFRTRLGTSLTGSAARKLCFRQRFPDRNLLPPLLDDLKRAYDAEIAWLDEELSQLLAALPPDALVVIVSDHGEAFEEHGWTLHGATLYDEELRVPLLLRLPGGKAGGTVVADPAMLLDVAPTILAQCGLRPPGSFQGLNLAPTWQGQQLPLRPIPAETKAPLEGQAAVSVILYPLKGIYSLFEGALQVYRLPDEHTPLPAQERAAHAVLRQLLQPRVEAETFWLLHAVGVGDYEAEIELPHDALGLFILHNHDPERDSFEVEAEGRRLRWHVYPGRDGLPKSLLLQPGQATTPLRLDARINGQRSPTQVFLGQASTPATELPVLVPATLSPVSPWMEAPFRSARAGFHVLRHAGTRAGAAAQVQPLDPATLRQLRALGYIR